jgi:hypothetical protein
VTKQYALSLKQPWAALLVHGRKTIEVRRWPTARRGRILIHAALVPDERGEAWGHITTPELRATADLRGGIIGQGDLIHCAPYRTQEAFVEDQARHLNDPSWFETLLYGFTFANLSLLPYRSYSGWMRFFPVDDLPQRAE